MKNIERYIYKYLQANLMGMLVPHAGTAYDGIDFIDMNYLNRVLSYVERNEK